MVSSPNFARDLEYRKRMWFIFVPGGYNSVRIIGYCIVRIQHAY